MTWTKQQTVSGNNGAVASTSVSATLAASKQGSLLVAGVMVTVNGATITPPAGWVQVRFTMPTNPVGGSLALFRYEYNPGGITAVAFTITSSLGAVVISEYISTPQLFPPIMDGLGGAFSDNNGTFQHGPNTGISSEIDDLCVWAVGYVNTTLLTINTFYPGFSQDGTAISTAGAANAVVHLTSNLNLGNTGVTGGPSMVLSGTPTAGPTGIDAPFLGDAYSNCQYVGPQNQGTGILI